MRLILLAPSGGGKGTVADYLKWEFRLPHISTGELFRKNMAERTELGKIAEGYVNRGTWVPDDVTVKMLLERIEKEDCKHGFVLDGFPRTLNQAQLLSAHISIDQVIELDIADEIVLGRLLGRWICPSCGKNYNTKFGAVDECRDCGICLIQREDDKEETILKRLASFRASVKDLTNLYDKHGLLLTVKVAKEDSPECVYAKVREELVKKGIRKPSGVM